MVLDASQTAIHEAMTLAYMSFIMCTGQFILRMISFNGIFTTLLLLAVLLYFSYKTNPEDLLSLQTFANSAIRLLADIIGFLVGALGFVLLISSSGARLAFTPESLLDILTGAGLSLGTMFLSIALTYFSNLSLFSIGRFTVNLISIPINLFSGLVGGGSSAPGGSGGGEAPARRRYRRRR